MYTIFLLCGTRSGDFVMHVENVRQVNLYAVGLYHAIVHGGSLSHKCTHAARLRFCGFAINASLFAILSIAKDA
jgi:hypothetical protein